MTFGFSLCAASPWVILVAYFGRVHRGLERQGY